MFQSIGQLPDYSAGIDAALQKNAAKPKGGMFGGGKFGLKEALAFGLAGLVSRRNPALLQGLLGAAMQRQNAARENEQYQQRRGDQMQDWIAQQTWKRSNPDPSNPHYFEDNSGNLMAIGADGKPYMVHKDPNPWKLVPNGLGGVVPVNIETLMRGQQGLPEVGSVVPDPRKGGAAPLGQGPFSPPERLKHGAMTSGRRTVEGNRLVGGVPNSDHLNGTAADYDGPDLGALLEEVRGLPGHRKSFIHDGHVHGVGDWRVPYFGKRGTFGLRGQ